MATCCSGEFQVCGFAQIQDSAVVSIVVRFGLIENIRAVQPKQHSV